MSTIRKQSIYSSLFIYAGFAIGALNVLYLFPTYFTPEQFGLTRIIMDIALIFSTICTAGTLPVTFKFLPFYQHHLPKEKNDLMSMVFIYSIICCIALYILFPFIKPWILRKFGRNSPAMLQYFYLVYPLTVSLVLFSILEGFAWMIKKAVLSNFLKEFLFRSLTTVLIILWIIGLINNYTGFITLYSSLNFISVGILFVVIYNSKQFYINFKRSNVTKRLAPMMLRFGSAYFLSAILNIVARTNDTLIIASQSSGGLVDAAIFTIGTYLITVMDVPQRSMVSSATAQIAQAWKDHDLAKLDRLYKKTALNLLIISSCIMGVILINSSLLIHVLGPTYSGIPFLMVILGFSKLIDLGTGLNSQILQLSKHWKIDLFTNMLFVVLSIILNYFLTRKYGIIGTAFGGMIAVVLFNLIRFIYIKKIYKLQPFSWRNAVSLIAAGLLTIAIYFLPSLNNIWIDSFAKTILFIALYTSFIIRFDISTDLNELYRSIIGKLFQITKR